MAKSVPREDMWALCAMYAPPCLGCLYVAEFVVANPDVA
ncbi:hypothetical protein MKSMC1_25850 [Mycobacterium kansasii]|nr:hypothetical protein MKSMC1_25850 [Mycobacterium kansasii]